MSSKDNGDGIFTFLAGLFAGLVAGGILGLLFSPKSGDELREDVQDFARNLPGRVNDELRNPNTRTREFIEKTRYNIENQVDKVKQDREAGRMAKAKRAEELASGYEFQ